MRLSRVYPHEVSVSWGSKSLGRGACGAKRSRASPRAGRNTSKICLLSYVLPVSCRGKASRRTFLFWCHLFLEGREGGGVFFSRRSFCLNRVCVKSRRASLASRGLGLGLLCSSEITEFYFISL